MKRVFAMVLLCSAIHGVSRAGSAEAKDVEITISPDRHTILPYEPLGITVTIKNKSGTEIERHGSQWTSIRTRKDGGNQGWQTYMACGPQPTPTPPRKLKLLPGQSFQDIRLIHVNSQNKPVFREPGVYYVQAGTPFGESEAIKIKVELPEGSTDVLDVVYDQQLFMLFDEYTATYYLEASGKGETLAKNLKDFKESPFSAPYSAWVTYGEFILRKVMIGRQSKPKQSALLKNLVTEYETLASKLPSPQKESLMIAMAGAKMDQSKKNAAMDLLQEIISAHADGYFMVKAQYLRSLYERK